MLCAGADVVDSDASDVSKRWTLGQPIGDIGHLLDCLTMTDTCRRMPSLPMSAVNNHTNITCKDSYSWWTRVLFSRLIRP